MTYYLTTLLVYFLNDAIWVLGLNIQMGIAGIVNLGYVLFFGLGAYVASVVTLGPASGPIPTALNEQYVLGMSLPFPLPWLAALLTGGTMAVLVGALVVRRLRGDYLAVVTLALAQIAWLLVSGNVQLFNGNTGLIAIPRPGANPADLVGSNMTFALIEAMFFALTLWFAQSLLHSPLGRTLRAIRDNEAAAAALGKDVARMRLIAFVCGACVSALAGALLAEYLTVWSPGSWTYVETFTAVAALIVGGCGNNWGAVLGALLVPVVIFEGVRFLPDIGGNSGLNDALAWVAIGILALLFLWFRPQGILPERPSRSFWRRAQRASPPHVRLDHGLLRVAEEAALKGVCDD